MLSLDFELLNEESVDLVNFTIDDIVGEEDIDGYTELARARIILLKSELSFDVDSGHKRTWLGMNEHTQKQARAIVESEEVLQFWCDLAQWDCGKVKQWLLSNTATNTEGRSHARRTSV